MASSILRRVLNNLDLDQQIHTQWTGPGDILSLLLLVGGDVIQRAIAQQAGSSLPTPVVFSFGWVAYAFTGLLSAVGNNLLMPPPDTSCIVISTTHGYARTNQSWILGRILRDFELGGMAEAARQALNDLLHRYQVPKKSLCVSIWEPTPNAQPKRPIKDWVWWSGYVVMFLQLFLASVAWGYWGDWIIFAITLGGTALAFLTASLPQWRRERWPCRDATSKGFVLCRGNGCQHALAICGNGTGVDLEDLASTGEGATTEAYTRLVMTLLTAGWLALLITVSGVKTQTWFLVGIGAIGMVHTVFVAGKSRSPSAFGIHIAPRDFVLKDDVMSTLKEVERRYPGIGISMLSTFFPGELRDADEIDHWKEQKETRKARYAEWKESIQPPKQTDP